MHRFARIRRTLSLLSQLLLGGIIAAMTSHALGSDPQAIVEFAKTVAIPGIEARPAPAAALRRPLLIAHRGASGYVPEHTLAAYGIAVLQGADFIEPDLVMTKDGQLIARHDNVLDLTTDVADKPEFAARKTTKVIDGAATTGWFSEDFTLAEIKTLRAIERIPALRPANARFNGRFEVPTLQDIIDLARAMETRVGRRIGLYPETKHPSHFAALGLAMETPLVETLHRNGYRGADAPVFIQSFETANLKTLRQKTALPLIQLLESPNHQPYDVQAAGGKLTYGDMATAAGLRDIARYANGVGPEKYSYIIPLDANGELHAANRTRFVADAHAAGLQVHPYTFRAENAFLPRNLRNGDDPARHGDAQREIDIFLEAGIDGLFSDQSDIAVAAKQRFLQRQSQQQQQQ